MSNSTRRVNNPQEGSSPRPQGIPIRALDARGNEIVIWSSTDGDFVFDSQDLNQMVNRVIMSLNALNPAPSQPQHSIPNLESFTIQEAADSSSSSSMPLCSICLEVISVGSVATRMPHCSHIFHHSCIIKWLSMRNTCPLCRTPI